MAVLSFGGQAPINMIGDDFVLGFLGLIGQDAAFSEGDSSHFSTVTSDGTVITFYGWFLYADATHILPQSVLTGFSFLLPSGFFISITELPPLTGSELLGMSPGQVEAFYDSVPFYIAGSPLGDVLDATDNGDTLAGLAGSDSLIGNGGADCLLGGNGNDSLVGNDGADSLLGGNGNDTLDGGVNIDSMSGGVGNDVYYVGDTLDFEPDQVTETAGAGIDSVFSWVGFTLPKNVENLTLLGALGFNATGNSLDNLIVGNAGNNIIDGKGGADTLVGKGGDDTYVVRDRLSTITDSSGMDTVDVMFSGYTLGDGIEKLVLMGTVAAGRGNGLDNTLTGNAAANKLWGLGGADILMGMAGADTMYGGAGDDKYYVDSASDLVVEAANGGIDTVLTTISYTLPAQVEWVAVADGAADVTGNSLANRIWGGAYGGVLDGRGGADTMIGGIGNDIYIVAQAGDVVGESFEGGGIDEIRSSRNFDLAINSNVENLTLTGTGNINGSGNALVNIITGNAGNNTLTSVGGDTLHGDAGSDKLYGSGAVDVLDGGQGADTMSGGFDADTYYVDDPNDVIVEQHEPIATGIYDHVYSSVSYNLPFEVEWLTLTGHAAINGSGGAWLYGNDAANVLSNAGELHGEGGDDTLGGAPGYEKMYGGAGNDTYLVDDSPEDLFLTELPGEGIDTVRASISIASLAANVEKLILAGTGPLNGAGNGLDNSITGNSGNNFLEGEDGADKLAGGQGDDTLIGGTGADVLLGVQGDDTFWYDPDDLGPAGLRIDGGSGFDTLTCTNVANDLDLRALDDAKIAGIEQINLAAGGAAHVLSFTASDVLALSDTTDELIVFAGGVQDQVFAYGNWQHGADTMVGADTFAHYTLDGASLLVSLAADLHIV